LKKARGRDIKTASAAVFKTGFIENLGRTALKKIPSAIITTTKNHIFKINSDLNFIRTKRRRTAKMNAIIIEIKMLINSEFCFISGCCNPKGSEGAVLLTILP
jgi:hypothetical protein